MQYVMLLLLLLTILVLTSIDAVSVKGGFGRQLLSMRAMAAVQLPWQSSSVLKTPPFRMPAGPAAHRQRLRLEVLV